MLMYKIVLLRHGESVWNRENRFTGWTDVDLTEKGVEEARAAVAEQKKAGYDFIKVHNVLPDELYRAVLDEAQRQSLDVVGHIPHAVRLEDAIRLGQRTF
ncbi:MAG TPA: histidine phosphatase family protein, partial [Hydrogenophilus thermoluteolus]|nr:histidine phosphatase family protein [Hydrogenophilus thermoluteolus]